MKKRLYVSLMALFLALNVLFVSCVGSFGLSNRVLAWNNSLGNKFVNELIFVLFCIIPVYEATLLVDAIIFNTMEFWTGSNNFADAGTPHEDKPLYSIETTESGYRIDIGDSTETRRLVYDSQAMNWHLVSSDETRLLLQLDGGYAFMPLPEGRAARIELSAAGIEQFRQSYQGMQFSYNR